MDTKKDRYIDRRKRENIEHIYIRILLSPLDSLTATVTTAYVMSSEVAISSYDAVNVVALDPNDVVVLSSLSRWDETNDVNDVKK